MRDSRPLGGAPGKCLKVACKEMTQAARQRTKVAWPQVDRADTSVACLANPARQACILALGSSLCNATFACQQVCNTSGVPVGSKFGVADVARAKGVLSPAPPPLAICTPLSSIPSKPSSSVRVGKPGGGSKLNRPLLCRFSCCFSRLCTSKSRDSSWLAWTEMHSHTGRCAHVQTHTCPDVCSAHCAHSDACTYRPTRTPGIWWPQL
eukprot:1152084-Pelagomonas_calceolata.AAC.11